MFMVLIETSKLFEEQDKKNNKGFCFLHYKARTFDYKEWDGQN